MTGILDTIHCHWLRNPQHFEAWSPLHLHMESGGGKRTLVSAIERSVCITRVSSPCLKIHGCFSLDLVESV